ncbi:cytochrome ubiquinol oxidase subunit I [Methylomicrobium sp. Wu6]|uniref:cytochrome ubiquinol oxidase subunit I n=1 Tax=Methylomicrobium sp. Wu6 TaxID=3107928 RepID=UPI002DD69295|nr:cytochrome ubiquinol oxidase subunit I [Methylomicrobium sp. Wu6]MEC4749058.1 cytochrome ubiquinol oxidase subunit I [Methylomicrobium sp. Wu6]
MEFLQDTLLLSRLQFALTAIFHILWPLLTVGLSIFLVVVEILWLKTKDRDYFVHARFWSKLFLLNFAVGVVSGIPMEFEFGTNWAPFSRMTGEFFGNILGYDGAMALMLEAGFLGIMMFGWNRVPAGMHLFATIMVALGSSLSAFWIMIANGWMQAPTGGHIEAGRYVVDSYAEALTNPYHYWGYAHMWLACIETSLLVVGGVSAWYILKHRHQSLFLKSLKLALAGLLAAAPLQILVGDVTGLYIFELQPAKGAAIEAHWDTNPAGQGAEWHILAWPDKQEQDNDWAISIPNALSLIVAHSLDGQVKGLKESVPTDQPPAIALIFYSFRMMFIAGLAMAALTLGSAYYWWRQRQLPMTLDLPAWLLKTWVAAIPLGYVATECGWIVREVGRQPWAVYGLLRTEQAASTLPASAVATSLGLFAVVYTFLLASFLVFARRIIMAGPNVDQPLPVFMLSAHPEQEKA